MNRSTNEPHGDNNLSLAKPIPDLSRWMTLLGPFLLIFLFIFVRYCYYGMEYYYQLDDYIQHHNYVARGVNSLGAVIDMGALGARPLAGLADVFVWTPLFSVMIVGVGAISAMFAASACLFRRVWRAYFGTGWMFLLVYTLLPLGFEGTYWMSASTRIVPGLFFAALALYLFSRWCTEGRRRDLVLYGVVQLVSYGFYEQILVLSFGAVFLVALLHWRTDRRRALWALLSVLNLLLYVLVTAQFSGYGLYSDRTATILPTDPRYFASFLPTLLSQLKRAFLEGGFHTLFTGFARGLALIAAQPNVLYILVITGLCVWLFLAVRREPVEAKGAGLALLTGAALALGPLIPFFILAVVWFSLRGPVASFCGIALAADALVRLALSRVPKRQSVAAVAAVLFAAFCCIASVSELHDYRETTRRDQQVVALIADTVTQARHDRETRIGVLNLESSYLEEQNYAYHEHIHGVTESAWALNGALEWYWGGSKPSVTPIPSDPMYRDWNYSDMRLDTFDVLYVYTGDQLIPVTAQQTGEQAYTLYGPDGQVLGRTWEQAYTGYLELE